MVICISEIIGSVYLYRTAPIVIALAGFGLAAIWATRRSARNRSEEPASPAYSKQRSEPRLANGAAVVAVAVLVAEWSTQTVAAYHHGMLNTDTLWYHMPFAARFVQDHSITGLHYVDAQAVTVFFPASSELIHSLGILSMGNDVLSPLINTLWLGLALLASWCIGRPFGVAPITLTGSAILFATPGLVATQPGGAYDDVVGLALFLSAVALLVNSQGLSERSQRVAWVIAAASAGLAIGTKWTFIGPAAALTVGFCVLCGSRQADPDAWELWLVALLLTGGFWYGRNLIAVGNPVPPLHLKLGPLSFPAHSRRPHLRRLLISCSIRPIGTNTSSPDSVSHLDRPGGRSSGCLHWALCLRLSKGDRLQRILGLVGLASAVIFVVSPQYLAAFGAPVFFAENVRYAAPAVILGLILLPINPAISRWQRARWVLLSYMAVLVATQFDSGIWPTNFFTQRFVGGPVRGSDSLIGLFVGVAVLIVGTVIFYMEKSVNASSQYHARMDRHRRNPCPRRVSRFSRPISAIDTSVRLAVSCRSLRAGSNTRTTSELASLANFRICNICSMERLSLTTCSIWGYAVRMAPTPHSVLASRGERLSVAAVIPTYSSRPTLRRSPNSLRRRCRK